MDSRIIISGYKYSPQETKRLLLIKPTLKYKKDLLSLYKDSKMWLYNGGGINKYTLKSVENKIKKNISLWREKKKISFFIMYDGVLIGTISLNDICKDFKNAYVGFLIHPDYWGKGFASEALASFIKFVFKNTILFRLSATVCSKNKASIKVLEKNNFKKEGLLKKSSIFNHKVYDNFIYSIIHYKNLYK